MKERQEPRLHSCHACFKIHKTEQAQSAKLALRFLPGYPLRE